MANLSISTAWSETVAFVTREGRLLFPIAFLLVALPSAVLQIAMPTPSPGQPPEIGAWLLLLPVAIVISMIGSLAIAFLALRPGASVAEALQVGARRFIYVFAATVLVAIGAFVIALPLVAVVGARTQGGDNPALGALGLLFLIGLLLVYLVLWVRLILMTAVGAVEDLGPVAIINRSWNLTRGHFWRLLAFVLLILVAALVVIFAVSAIAGVIIILIAGPPQPDSLSTYLLLLVTTVLQTIFSTLFITLLARIYAQLSGHGAPNVFA